MLRRLDMGNLKVRLAKASSPSCTSCDGMEAMSTGTLFPALGGEEKPGTLKEQTQIDRQVESISGLDAGA